MNDRLQLNLFSRIFQFRTFCFQNSFGALLRLSSKHLINMSGSKKAKRVDPINSVPDQFNIEEDEEETTAFEIVDKRPRVVRWASQFWNFITSLGGLAVIRFELLFFYEHADLEFCFVWKKTDKGKKLKRSIDHYNLKN